VGSDRDSRDPESADQRKARVEEIRRRVRQGEYQVDVERLAERVLPVVEGEPDDEPTA
jgi:anti-sigma28 factor (negative regulator of flagellin synthesis)